MVWQMYIFCHHNTCSFHFCGTKLMYVYCIKRVPRLHQRAPNGTPPVSAAPTQKAQAPSSVSPLNGYLNRLNFFLATSLTLRHKIRRKNSAPVD